MGNLDVLYLMLADIHTVVTLPLNGGEMIPTFKGE